MTHTSSYLVLAGVACQMFVASLKQLMHSFVVFVTRIVTGIVNFVSLCLLDGSMGMPPQKNLTVTGVA